MNAASGGRWGARRIGVAAAVVLAVAAVVVVGMRMRQRPEAVAAAATGTVTRADIEVTIEATGTVEPINLVEVKSKASGQITRMPVEIGSVVTAGDLLVQVDPRDVRNSFDQSQASLVAAEARAKVARQQLQRSTELLAGQVITASEHESAVLEDANAQSQLVAARTNLDIARQRLEDATVRAPIAGTVLEKPVAVGQVISSATSSVTGGTTLLKMADLARIRMRALVVESDIGQVREGQAAAVVVDAYPQRTFAGTVEKIEPQAVVQQSVTMFPVLISISNEQGLLLPGMNGEVTMKVEERANALSVPVDALRTRREMEALAPALGLDVATLGNARGDSARGATPASASAPARSDSAGAGATSGRSGRMRGGRRGGAGAGAASGATATAGAASGFGAGTRTRSAPKVAVVQTAGGYELRLVRTGISNYDVTEVLSGLAEGETVLLLGELEVTQERTQRSTRMQQRMGGGLTTRSSPSPTPSGGSNRPSGDGPPGGPR